MLIVLCFVSFSSNSPMKFDPEFRWGNFEYKKEDTGLSNHDLCILQRVFGVSLTRERIDTLRTPKAAVQKPQDNKKIALLKKKWGTL
jgi:hypothetical protein